MMKNKKKLAFIAISTILIVFIAFIVFIPHNRNRSSKNTGSSIEYDFKNSSLNDFYIEGDYAVFDCLIKVRNNTDTDLYYYISADVSGEGDVVSEKIANAYDDKSSLNKKKFFITAHTEDTLPNVYFKAKKGSKVTKNNRLPLEIVNFEVVNK